MTPAQLAQRFHEAYERLAPLFGYETRTDTRAFDPESPNGRLMIAVCAEILTHHTQGRWCADLHCSKCYSAGTWQNLEIERLRSDLAEEKQEHQATLRLAAQTREHMERMESEGTVLYSQVSNPTNFNPTGGSI